MDCDAVIEYVLGHPEVNPHGGLCVLSHKHPTAPPTTTGTIPLEKVQNWLRTTYPDLYQTICESQTFLSYMLDRPLPVR